jgi:cell division protein FtsB
MMRIDVDQIRELCHRNRRRLATAGVALIACWIAYVAVWGANGMIVYRHKRAEYRELQQRIVEMQQENERLTHENKALRTNPEAIEKEAREQLHYTRPGEVVYVKPDAQPQTPGTATAQNSH